MAVVTVTNKDSTIIAAIKTTLTAITISDATFFAKVADAESEEDALAVNTDKSPMAALIFNDTEEYDIPDLKTGCVCNLTLLLAQRVNTDAATRVASTRLVNIAKNAINASPPSGTVWFAEPEGELHKRLEWGEVDTDSRQGWSITTIELGVSYTITNSTSH